MTTTSDTQTTGTALDHRKGMPPIFCRPWCTDGTGHVGESTCLDQRCSSDPALITRSLEPMCEAVGGGWYPMALEVFCQEGRSYHPAVVLFSAPDDVEVLLTADEARRLARSLEATAELLEGAQ
jgi:hypothetical protein